MSVVRIQPLGKKIAAGTLIIVLFLVLRHFWELRHPLKSSRGFEHFHGNVSVGGSVLSQSFMECMIDVGKNMPINGSGVLKAHHYDARTGKWNEDIRFRPFKPALTQQSIIMDVGGHTDAYDSRKFLELYPGTRMHIYEPVIEYFNELKQRWKDVSNAKLHAYGLGASSRKVQIPISNLAGQSTFVMETDGDEKSEHMTSLDIKDVREELQTMMMGRDYIDVIHLNCEGCEWELLSRLAQLDMLRVFRYIQVSFHNYGEDGIGELLPQYCLIREALMKTHEKADAVPFAWERWVLRSRPTQ